MNPKLSIGDNAGYSGARLVPTTEVVEQFDRLQLNSNIATKQS